MEKYLKSKDKLRYLLGKLLVRHAICANNQPVDLFHNIQYENNGRPFVDSSLSFNIAHSGDFIVCATCNQCRVGIDIEKIREVELEHYQNTFSARQSLEIQASLTPLTDFFKLWVIKESVLKADGAGLSFPLQNLETRADHVLLRGKPWYYSLVDFKAQYACSVASDAQCQDIRVEDVIF